MKKISFIMHSDSDGKITVVNTIKYIMDNLSEINVPDADISTIPLAALTLSEDKTKHCVEGCAKGKVWIDGKCTVYEFTLTFA